MCLAIPLKIIELNNDNTGRVQGNEVTYNVNLSLIDSPQLGDFVLVHAGFAIDRLDKEEANTRIELFKELSEIDIYDFKN